MLELHSEAVYHTSGPEKNRLPADNPLIREVSPDANLVLGFFKNQAGQDFLMVMNKDYTRPANVSITLKNTVKSVQEFRVDLQQWKKLPLRSENGSSIFEILLRAGGGKLLAVQSNGESAVQKKTGRMWNFRLFQNYPNPFNSRTRISFQIDRPGRVLLRIFNLAGKQVATLIDKKIEPGRYDISWNGKNSFGRVVASGIYWASLQTKKAAQVRKLIYLR